MKILINNNKNALYNIIQDDLLSSIKYVLRFAWQDTKENLCPLEIYAAVLCVNLTSEIVMFTIGANYLPWRA